MLNPRLGSCLRVPICSIFSESGGFNTDWPRAQRQRHMRVTIVAHSRHSPVLYCCPSYAVVVANPDLSPNRLRFPLASVAAAALASVVLPLLLGNSLFPAVSLSAPLPPPLVHLWSSLLVHSLVPIRPSPPAARTCPFHRAKARSIQAPNVAYASLAGNHLHCLPKRQSHSFCVHSRLAPASQPLPPTSLANSMTNWMRHCCCHRCCPCCQSWVTIWQAALRKSSPNTWHCCMFSNPPV